MKDTAPKVVKQKIIAESHLFEIEQLELRFSNGQERKFERVKRRFGGGGVMIIPLLDDDTILLVREYGAGIGRYTLAFPKGGIEPEESLLKTANRELQEEIGYAARHLVEIPKIIAASPAYMSGTMHLVLATDLYACQLEGDEPEPIEVVQWKLNNLDALLKHPEFLEARSIAALILMLQMRGLSL